MKILVLECLAFLVLIKVLMATPNLGQAALDGLTALTVLLALAIVATIIVVSMAERRP